MLELFIYPVLLSGLHYLSGWVHAQLEGDKKLEKKLFSFASGVLITFLFLYLLPELVIGTQHLAYFLYIYVLIGFTSFLLIHETLYKHVPNKRKLYFELREAHAIVSSVFHFIIGLVLVTLIRENNLLNGLLVFIPIAIHVAFGSLASHHITAAMNYRQTHTDKIMQFFVTISPILGALCGVLFVWSNIVIYALYGVIGGIMLFMVIREFIPSPKEARLGYFVAGQVFFVFLILLQFFLLGLQ